jgi:glycosyltransferase involved in cell wall biosynthesis
LRTLHTIQSLNNRLGGATHAGLNICRYLDEAGQTVEVVSTQGAGDELEYLDEVFPNVTKTLLPRTFPARWFNGQGLAKWLRTHIPKFDLVALHAVFSFVTLRASQECQRLGVPYVLHPHGSLDPFDLQKRRLFKRLLGPILIRPILKGSAGVFCTSQREAALLETYNTSPRRFVVPLPVPPVEGLPSSRYEFRRKHGIPENAFVVLFLSRFDYKKGLDFLVPAISECRKNCSDLYFVLAGGGKEDFVQKLRQRIADSNLAPWTREIGFVAGKEKASAFLAADLFALPSLNENFGMVIVEAMQNGLPVLVSDQVYIHQELVAANAGFVCQPSSESCRLVLSRFLGDRQMTARMGVNAKSLAMDHFSPQASTQQLLEAYSNVLRCRGT